MENRKNKFGTSIAATLIYIATCLLSGCVAHTGTRNGQVFDGATNKPIEGAVVSYTWRYEGFLEDAIVGHGGAPVTYETLTDKEGKYFIPDITIERKSSCEISLRPEEVIIYKDKYAAYELYREYKKDPVGRSFGYPDIKQTYHEKNNTIKLYIFKEGESHYKHVDWIGMHSPERNKLLLKELEPEKRLAREEELAKYRK
jgi:hypothetical protein